jgi:membrane protease YdiL (CAAX protease family)
MRIAETVSDLVDMITAADIALSVLGIILLAVWLHRTSLGTRALAGSDPRRNNMAAHLPFVPLLVWLLVVGAGPPLREQLWSDLADWQAAFVDNAVLLVAAVSAMAVIVLLARISFARGLRGFGLDPKTLPKDFGVAVLNLVSVYPLVLVTLLVTIFCGKMIWGEQFEIQKHEELELIVKYPKLSLRLLVVVVTTFVVPVFEELLFRGMFQTMVRSRLSAIWSGRRPHSESTTAWLAIAVTSILFATIHSDITHWPALFMLAMCLGYAYEKSGSLFRPIFMHSLFNGASVLGAFYQG